MAFQSLKLLKTEFLSDVCKVITCMFWLTPRVHLVWVIEIWLYSDLFFYCENSILCIHQDFSFLRCVDVAYWQYYILLQKIRSWSCNSLSSTLSLGIVLHRSIRRKKKKEKKKIFTGVRDKSSDPREHLRFSMTIWTSACSSYLSAASCSVSRQDFHLPHLERRD